MFGQRNLLVFLLLVFLLIGLVVSELASTVTARASAGQQPIEATSDQLIPLAASALLPWQFDVVDMPGYFDHMSDRSLHYDSAGNLHLVYGGDHLYYATFDGADWHVEVVDDGVGVGMGASLDLDADDRPHIAYIDMINYKLKYAYWTGESWNLQLLDDVYAFPERTSIAVDSSDHPHIAYKKAEWIPPNPTCPGLGYVHWTGSQWQFERFSDCGNYLSMALDTAGKPHISFYNDQQIKYANKANGNWIIDSVGASHPGYYSSLTLDSSDRPHIAYTDYDFAGGELVYAYWDGNSWIPDVIQPISGYEEFNVSLALDSTDTPHISYEDEYITWSGSEWVMTDTLDHLSAHSITLDGDDRPAISYGSGYRMYCAHWGGADWRTDLIDGGGDAGVLNSLALDSKSQPQISYYNRSGYGASINYAQRSGDTWMTEVITTNYTYFPPNPPNPPNPYHMSLALDGNDDPHVSFWFSDYYDAGLYYGYRSGEQWLTEFIAADIDGPSTLAVDTLDRPHISYVDDNVVKYGYRSTTGWVIEDVGSSVSHISAALALDDADRPRIVYADFDNGLYYLKYASWTGADWQTDVVGVFADLLRGSTTLALDDTGRPHITYIVDGQDDHGVRYAFWNGYEWIKETVEDRNYMRGKASIVVDSAGSPYIAYAAGTYGGLQVASRIDGKWVIQNIVTTQCGDLSIAIDGIAMFISYYHGRGHGLMLAGPKELKEHVYLPVVIKS